MAGDVDQKKKWYQSSFGVILLLVLFFPVGLYLMWKHTNWNKGVKIGLTGIYAFFVFAVASTDSPSNTSTMEDKTEETQNADEQESEEEEELGVSPSDDAVRQKHRELEMFQEQKDRAEKITRDAIDLISEDKIAEAVGLYEERWKELAELRTDIMFDDSFSPSQKKNIDKALEAEQESITNILKTYEELYEYE